LAALARRWRNLHFSRVEREGDVLAAAIVLHAEQRISLPAVYEAQAAHAAGQLQRRVYAALAYNL
jgi:hypothetical protein